MKIYQWSVLCSEDDQDMSVKDYRLALISPAHLVPTVESAVALALESIEAYMSEWENPVPMANLIWATDYNVPVRTGDVPGVLRDLKHGGSFLCAHLPEDVNFFWWIAIHEHDIA